MCFRQSPGQRLGNGPRRAQTPDRLTTQNGCVATKCVLEAPVRPPPWIALGGAGEGWAPPLEDYETSGGRCLTAIRGGRSLVASARKWYTVFRKTYGRMYYITDQMYLIMYFRIPSLGVESADRCRVRGTRRHRIRDAAIVSLLAHTARCPSCPGLVWRDECSGSTVSSHAHSFASFPFPPPSVTSRW